MNEEIKTFGDALESAKASFGAEQELPKEQPIQQAPTEQTPEQPTEQSEVPMSTEQALEAETRIADEAIATAQQAADIAKEKDAQVVQLTQALEAEKQKSSQLEGVVREMNQAKEEQVIEEALVPPVLDLSSLMFESPEAIATAQAKYASDLTEYNRKVMEKEYQPLKEQARKLEEYEVLERMKLDLRGREDFEGFDSPEMQHRMKSIIENNAFLKNADLPIADKYINAYAIARGADAMYAPKAVPEEPKAPTTDELMAIYNNNPEFRAAIENKRIEELNPGQQVPPLTASSGAGNVVLNIKQKPQTLGDARERAKSRFFH